MPCLPLIHLYTRRTLLFECSSYHGAWPFPPEMSAPTWMHTELPKTLVSCESSPEISTRLPTISQPRSLQTFSLLSLLSMVCFPLLKWWVSRWNDFFGVSLLSGETLVLVKNISKSCPLSLSIISASHIIFSLSLTASGTEPQSRGQNLLHAQQIRTGPHVSHVSEIKDCWFYAPFSSPIPSILKIMLGLLFYNNVNSMRS